MSRGADAAMSTAAPAMPAQRKVRVVNAGDRTFIGLLTGVGLSILLVGAVIVGVLWHTAQPALSKFGPGFVTGTDWDPVQDSFGALPFIYGTLVTSALALLLALPLAVGMALFLTEMAPVAPPRQTWRSRGIGAVVFALALAFTVVSHRL